MASMTALLILTGVLSGLSKKTKTKPFVFPDPFSVPCIGATILFIVLLIASPSNHRSGMESVFLLLYSCVVTPVFEELLFRGCIWNKLSGIFRNKWATYLITTILFGLWHLVYIDSIAFRVEDGLVTMTWRTVVGSSLTAVSFYRKMGYVFKKGMIDADEYGVVRLEKRKEI